LNFSYRTATKTETPDDYLCGHDCSIVAFVRIGD